MVYISDCNDILSFPALRIKDNLSTLNLDTSNWKQLGWLGSKRYESGEAQIAVPEGATAARPASLMGEVSGEDLPLKSGRVKVPYHPFEIVSLRLSYPHSQALGK